MTDLVRSCHTEFYGDDRCSHNYVYLLKIFFYIYKYLGPDKPYSLSFIRFPRISNRYFISHGNARGEKKIYMGEKK